MSIKARVQKDFKAITLLFGGVGGGIPFIELRAMLTALLRQAEDGDEKAQEIINLVTRFATMCRLAAGRVKVKL